MLRYILRRELIPVIKFRRNVGIALPGLYIKLIHNSHPRKRE